MRYFDLLRTKKYFDIFLDHYNSQYSQYQYKKEPLYSELIKRHYKIGQDGISHPSIYSDLHSYHNHVAALITDCIHIDNAYNSLKTEFGMGRRGAKLVEFDEFWDSIQNHKAAILRLTQYRMDDFDSNVVPPSLLGDLKDLFYGLKVVPPKQKQGKPPEEGTKLVAVSKTLHFLLPNLVMPIDNKYVLGFLRKNVPPKIDGQFNLFKKLFDNYIELTYKLKLNPDNGDGNWWNISVPKRIDNAIAGFWQLFNDNNMERIICDHIDSLLYYLSKAPKVDGKEGETGEDNNDELKSKESVCITSDKDSQENKSTTYKGIKHIKFKLAKKYISDLRERKYFLKTSDGINNWGPYIAGLILNKDGKEPFILDDIRDTLDKELPNAVYNKKSEKHGTLMPADISWNSPQTNKGFENFKFPALEITKDVKKPSYEYKFIGFREALQKKLKRFPESDSLKQALKDYQLDC